MGLDNFKTEGPRSRKEKDTKTSPDHVIHTAPGVDVSGVKIPSIVEMHEVNRLTISKPDADGEEVQMCTCVQCNITGDGYSAIVKRDHLKFKDTLWYQKFREIALNSELEFDDNVVEAEPEESDDDSEESDSSGGLMSFKS